MANMKDFATSVITNTPGTSGTTVSVIEGQGSRFPAAPFKVTVHPQSELPTLSNSEVMLVTAVSGDDFTVTRSYGEADAQDVQPSWRISNTFFKEDYDEKADQDDLDTHTSNTSNPHSVTKSQVGLGNVTNDTQLKAASNLSDLPSVSDARTNLGLGSLAVKSAVAISDITATGTPSSSNYLCGDGTWSTPANTTYSEITTAEIDAGTASTARAISGRRAKHIIDAARNGKLDTSGGTITGDLDVDGDIYSNGVKVGAKAKVGVISGTNFGAVGSKTISIDFGFIPKMIRFSPLTSNNTNIANIAFGVVDADLNQWATTIAIATAGGSAGAGRQSSTDAAILALNLYNNLYVRAEVTAISSTGITVNVTTANSGYNFGYEATG